MVSLVRTHLGDAQVFRLSVSHFGQLDVQVVQVASGDGFVQDLGQGVDVDGEVLQVGEFGELLSEFVVLGVEQGDLGQHLVRERARHHERRVAGGATQVDQSAVGQKDDVAAVLHQVSVDLRLDVDHRFGVVLQPGDVDFNVKVTDVAHDGVFGHLFKVLADDDVSATSGGDEDLTDLGDVVHGVDLVTGNGGLQGVDGVDFGDDDASTHRSEGVGTTLTDVTEPGDDGGLTGDHDVGGSLDPVDQRFSAPVQVVELGLGDGVVDVDGGDLELTFLDHLVQVVDTGGGFFRKTVAVFQHFRVLFVDHGGQVTTVVQDQVQLLAVLERVQLLFDTPVVFFFGFPLPGEHGHPHGGDGGGGVVLGGEDVARGPGDFGTEGNQRLDEDGGLNGHVQAPGDSGALQRLRGAVLLLDVHETRHFVFGQFDVLLTESGKRDVSDLVVFSSHGDMGVD